MSDTDTNESLVDRFRSRYLFKLTAVAVVVLLIIAAVGFASVSSANSSIRDNTRSELTSLSDLQSQTVNQWTSSIRRQMSLLSQSREMESTDPEDIQRFLNEQIEGTNGSGTDRQGLGEEVVDIHYVREGITSALGNRSPEILHSSDESLNGMDPSEADPGWLGLNMTDENQIEITGAYDAPWNDGETVAVVTPVNVERANKLKYRIVLVVDTERASEILLEAPGSDGLTLVTDGGGDVVFSTDQSLVGRSISEVGTNTEGITGMATTEPRYLDDVSVGGTSQATGASPVGETVPWTIATMQPTSSAFSLAQSIQTTILILLGVVVLAFLLFFVLISRGAIADIRALSAKAAKVADSAGDSDVALETDRTDEIGQLVRSVDRMQRSLNEQITERIEELEELNERMTSAVDEQSDVMNDCAEGDLARRMNTDTGVDQLDALATAFNSMMDDLQDSIEEALAFSYTVASASEQAAAAASESKQASRRVSEGTQEISHGTDRQSEELAAIVEEMSSFSASIEEVASSANQLSTRSNDAATTAADGREAAREAVEQLRTIEAETEEVVDSFEALREEAEAIEEIVDFISQVAEQTNMLALNANIEASRAGSGEGDEEGFGVVAEEIKDLATETQDAAGDVEERLNAIQERTRETSGNIDDAQASIRQGTQTIQEALDALDDIAEAVQDVDVSVQEIDDIVEEQSETAQEVVTRVEEVSDIAEQNAHQAEDVAAAAEEQTVTVDQISSTVDELSDRADQLADHLDQFTVEASPAAESAAMD